MRIPSLQSDYEDRVYFRLGSFMQIHVNDAENGSMVSGQSTRDGIDRLKQKVYQERTLINSVEFTM